MPLFRKKPVVIEAIRWDGTNWSDVLDFCSVEDPAGGVPARHVTGDVENLGSGRMPVLIHTLEGDLRAELGDWIIKGFYPCKPDVFETSCEEVG